MSLTSNSNRILLWKHRVIRWMTPRSFMSEMCRNRSSASHLVQSCCQNKMLAVSIFAEPDTECSHLYFYLTFVCGGGGNSGGGRPVTAVRDCVTTFVKEKIGTIPVVLWQLKQVFYAKKHDPVLTLIKWFLCLNPNQITSTALWQH